MAFITNQNKDGATTLAKRLTELVSHADTLDMLVGFFYFSVSLLRYRYAG